jgi:hypothetical protein
MAAAFLPSHVALHLSSCICWQSGQLLLLTFCFAADQSPPKNQKLRTILIIH